MLQNFKRSRELSALTFNERERWSGTLVTVGDSFDWTDPNNWLPAETGVFWISLSNRYDVQCQVDREDYFWATQWLWCHTYGSGWRHNGAHRQPNKIYARRAIHTPYGNRTIWLHRQICERAYGPPPSHLHVADHWNGDSLNCRRGNLRWATLSENSKNLYGSAWLQTRMFD